MPKIYCADLICKYNKNKKCSAKEVNLSASSIITLHNGRQEFNTCRTIEFSDEWIRLGQKIKNIINKEKKL